MADGNVELVEGSVIHPGCEVFYPGRFTQQFPNGTMPNLPPSGTGTVIPVYRLSHGTYEQQAVNIRPDPSHPFHYIFGVAPKLPKQFPQGETYQYAGFENKFTKIPSDRPVLPGKYSWWGVSVEDWYTSGLYADGQQMRGQVLQHKLNHKYVAEYLQTDPPECPYGNKVFTIDLDDMLQCYINSRTDVINNAMKNVKFRFAGTLRYRLEICYVIIVSLANDDAELGCFNTTDIFSYNSLTKRNGESSIVRWFTLNHMIKCDTGNYQSWETPAFAFYFPSYVQGGISIPKQLVTELPVVNHKYCPL